MTTSHSTDETHPADHAVMLFACFIQASEIMKELTLRLTHANLPQLHQDKIVRTTDLRDYAGDGTLELFVDVETKSGRAYAWCEEVTLRNGTWIVQRDVRMHDHTGQHIVRELPEESFSTTQDLANALPRLTQLLADTFDEIEIK